MNAMPSGLAVLEKVQVDPAEPRAHLVHALPHPDLSDEVNHWRWLNQDHYLETWEQVWVALRLGLPTFFGTLALAKVSADGVVVPYGIVGHKVVTKAAADAIIAFLSKSDVATGQNWAYHGIGKGTAAEAVGNTGLSNELATEYATSNTRPSGSQAVATGSSSTAVYRTAATIAIGTVGAAQVITEHGVFSAAARGTGTLLDRSMFSGSSISLNSNEAIAAQYDFTFTAGG